MATACALCGKPIALCCDIYETYEDEDGKEYLVCGDCIAAHGLETNDDNRGD